MKYSSGLVSPSCLSFRHVKAMILRPAFQPPSRRLDYGEVVRLLLEKPQSEEMRGPPRQLRREEGTPRMSFADSSLDTGDQLPYDKDKNPRKSSIGNPRGPEQEEAMISLFGGEMVVPVVQVTSKESAQHTHPMQSRPARTPHGQATIDQFFGGGQRPPGAAQARALKKRRVSTAPNNRSSTDRPIAPSPSKSLIGNKELFTGISSVSRNIAVSERSRDSFLHLLDHAETCALGLLWPDGSTSHSSLTTKFCTPSVECTRWNCACDRTIRINAMRSPIGFIVFALDIPGSKHADSMYLLPIACDVEELSSTLPASQRIEFVKHVLGSSKNKLIFNSQITLLALLTMIPDSSIINFLDPRIAAFLCDSDSSEGNLELPALLRKYSSPLRQDSHPQTLGKLAKATFDLFYELRAAIDLQKKLSGELLSRNAARVFNEMEMPLVVSLVRMERLGVGVDIQQLKTLRILVEQGLQSIIQEVEKHSQGTINLSSPEQVAELLFDRLGLPVQGHGKRHASTSEEDLMKILDLHPVVQLILDHRALSKLLSTYIIGLEQFIVKDRISSKCSIHAVWKQTSVRTGRLSCCRPNLQNIPQDQTVRGIEIKMRSVFIAPTPDYVFVSADYSQIEMRVLAQVSRDPILCGIFQAGGDIYVKLASQIFHKAEEAVEKVERTRAKTICLGVIYGMGVKAAAARLDISIREASQLMNSFFSKFSHVQEWMVSTKRNAATNGYVETMTGRRRYLSPGEDDQTRAAVDRQAVNSVVQGSASDVIKCAMLLVRENLDAEGLHDAQLVMQVHDEIVVECSAEPTTLEKVVSCIRNAMETSVVEKLGIDLVPLRVSVSAGKNFAEMDEISEFSK